uniref:EOR-2 n=1 Tax=Caenorhabditis tropicalis TaxID=1561998 RepID=A0A1I7TN18_9PELO
MDQHNQKSLLPDFSTNGFSGQFNGLQHQNANSIMSTLHTLQMQSMGNQILPPTDLHCDLQNQLLIEQLSAMQSMYNTINNTQKLDPNFSQLSQSNLTLPAFSTMTGTEPTTSNSFYSSMPSTSGLQNPVSQAISATNLPNLALPSPLIIDNKLGGSLNMKLPANSIPQAQAAVEDWMKNICVDTLQHFGLSLPEDDVAAGSLYRRPSSADKGLSPIAFTPPDSPQHELTFDEIFGFTSAKKDSSLKPEPEKPAHVPSTSRAAAQPAKPTTKDPRQEEEDQFIANFKKPKNVPVYKQKAALMSLEAREAAKKEDPNYDAFEFEDDDEFMFGGPIAEVKKEFDPPKKIEQPKATSTYIPGVGFEIQGAKEHKKRWHPAHALPVVATDSTQNDKVFFTIADKIRTRRDQEFTCSFFKPEQSTGNECSRNTRKVTKDEPLLPKFIIRIQKLQTHTHEPRRKYKRKNQKSDNDDSDYDEVSYKKRKVIRKVYSIHKCTDANSRKTVLDFQIGPGVPAADKKRLSSFGPAEGILPKGTYVVCKADMLRDDCAVWRVDNQNMLQKFLQLRNIKTNKLVYKSSSTYSGWCEQISSQYFRVSVKIIKQTRSETTVEPEIPLAELFCASSVEWFKHPGTVCFKSLSEEEEAKKEAKPEEDVISTEPKRVALNAVLNACLTQVFSKKHIESLLEKNDWTYTRSVAEIETNNKQCEELIRKRIPVEMKHNMYIGTYTRLAISKSSYTTLTKCQICKRKKPRRVIHFFDKTSYNINLVVDKLVEDIGDENQEDSECPLVADAISCGRCSMAVEFLHSMHHLKFHMLRLCEYKLEEIGTAEIDYHTERIVDAARSDKKWIQSVIQKYCELWDQVRYEFRDV